MQINLHMYLATKNLRNWRKIKQTAVAVSYWQIYREQFYVLTNMSAPLQGRYEFRDLAHMVYFYGYCDGNARAARREFITRFPGRPQPSSRFISNLFNRLITQGTLISRQDTSGRPRRVSENLWFELAFFIKKNWTLEMGGRGRHPGENSTRWFFKYENYCSGVKFRPHVCVANFKGRRPSSLSFDARAGTFAKGPSNPCWFLQTSIRKGWEWSSFFEQRVVDWWVQLH